VFVRKIAEGGSAVVHLAWDQQEQQYCAIKMLQAELAKKPALRNRFEREGRTMMQLDHKNIIKVFDTVNDDESAYLVMEYAEGGSVIDWLERHGGRAMPPRMAAEIALQLCAGIKAAHDQGVIHRDIKPHNLVIDRRGVCKVTDFGIAQAVSGPRMTLTGTVMGTVGYMAPEQHESAKHADERADIYSIAATLYTLVKGEAQHHLFMAEERDFEGIPPQLADIIRKGSQFRKEARYSNVGEMAAALRKALDKLPADPPGTPPLIPTDLEPLGSGPPEPGSLVRGRAPSGNTPSVEALSNLRIRTDGEGRTPSSILPRHSLTGPIKERSRRPQIRSREELLRAERRLAMLRYSLVAVLLATVVCGVLAVVGWWRIDSDVRAVNDAESALIRSAKLESGLPTKLDGATQVDTAEMQRLFDQVLTENDPKVREGAVERLLNLMGRSLDSLSGQLGLEAATKQTEQARKNIKAANDAYLKRQSELSEAQDGFVGWLACHSLALKICAQY
jgi:serine/threonine protein kinase